MGELRKRYMNPITFEAEMFVNSLKALSTTYNHIDAVMVSSLEKVMNAIESFLDSNPKEILAMENTQLVECDNISQIKRIYHCSHCKTDLGKSVEKATLHLIEKCTKHCDRSSRNARDIVIRKSRKERRKENKSMQEKQLDQAVKLTKKTRSLLTTDLNKFFDDYIKVGTKLKCMPDYEKIEKDLMNIISPVFPNVNIKVYKFGSRIAGIGSRESDLDLYIDIGDTFNIFQNRADKDALAKMYKVANALTNNNKSWKGLVKIDKARVPILKIIHTPSAIECDINFSNSLGTVNTKFLEYIFNIQPVARLLCIFIKKWLNRTSLNSEVSTYSFILMVIFFLQVQKVLPSMERLQVNVNKNKALAIGPWLCTYATLSLHELNIEKEDIDQPNMLKMIRGFFTFYIEFNFDNDVVCPYLGKVVKKSKVQSLMPERYVEYISRNDDFALQLDKPVIVQDPIQLNHNTTKGLSTFTHKVFKLLMSKSLEMQNETFISYDK